MCALKEKLSIVEEKLDDAEEDVQRVEKLNARAVDENNDFLSQVRGTLLLHKYTLINYFVASQVMEYREKIKKLEDQVQQQQVRTLSTLTNMLILCVYAMLFFKQGNA